MKDKWIKFKDRTPSPKDKIFVATATGHAAYCGFYYKEIAEAEHWTHWMPFEPPPAPDPFDEWVESAKYTPGLECIPFMLAPTDPKSYRNRGALKAAFDEGRRIQQKLDKEAQQEQ